MSQAFPMCSHGHLRRICAVVLVAVLLVSSCASTAAEPQVDDVPLISADSQVSRPIDAYLPSLRQHHQLWEVRAAAMTACYSAHGVPGTTNLPPNLAADLLAQRQDDVARSRLYGLFDTTNAHRHGYSPPFDQRGLRVPAPPAPPEVVRTCERAGNEAVGGLALATDETILPDGGPPLATGDSRFTEAVAKWSACMNGLGYTYRDPVAPTNDRKWLRPVSERDGTRPPPTQAEIALATADVRCKVVTNLVGVATAVQSAYDRRYIESHRTQLADFTARVLEWA
jgi:hypothetical protein